MLVEERKAGEPVSAGGPPIERLTGRTRGAKLVHFDAPAGRIPLGALLDVRITRTGAWSLQGEPAAAPAGDPAPAHAFPMVAGPMIASPGLAGGG